MIALLKRRCLTRPVSTVIEYYLASYPPTYIILFFCLFVDSPIGQPSNDPTTTTKPLHLPPTNLYCNNPPPYPIYQSTTIQDYSQLYTATQPYKPPTYQQNTQTKHKKKHKSNSFPTNAPVTHSTAHAYHVFYTPPKNLQHIDTLQS